MFKSSYKKELWFSLACIAIYVAGISISDAISEQIGVNKIITAPAAILMALILWFIMKKAGTIDYFGIKSLKDLDYKRLIFLLPFILIATVNLWNGITIKYSVLEMGLFLISMLAVGFLEEIIFRGFLFQALSKKNIRTAVIISSITFGIGHIVNLANGADFLPTLMQICYAISIGFMFTVFVLKTGNILPCMICHGVLNSLEMFSSTGNLTYQFIVSIVLILITSGYAIYLLKMKPQPQTN